jgi:hypothetical protein
VEHVYFYGATSAPAERTNAYLEQAYQLDRDFDRTSVSTGQLRPTD